MSHLTTGMPNESRSSNRRRKYTISPQRLREERSFVELEMAVGKKRTSQGSEASDACSTERSVYTVLSICGIDSDLKKQARQTGPCMQQSGAADHTVELQRGCFDVGGLARENSPIGRSSHHDCKQTHMVQLRLHFYLHRKRADGA